MRRARAVINTPVGHIFTVDDCGKLYFNIKEVCSGIGLRGHSPWSWHAERGDNRQRYYRRYTLKQRSFTFNANGHGSITMISLEGLYDYLENPRLNNALALMFKAWLNTNYPIETTQEAPAQAENDDATKQYPLDLINVGIDAPIPNQISMDQDEKTRELMPEQPKRWKVKYICPVCGKELDTPSRYCPECGERLIA